MDIIRLELSDDENIDQAVGSEYFKRDFVTKSLEDISEKINNGLEDSTIKKDSLQLLQRIQDRHGKKGEGQERDSKDLKISPARRSRTLPRENNEPPKYITIRSHTIGRTSSCAADIGVVLDVQSSKDVHHVQSVFPSLQPILPPPSHTMDGAPCPVHQHHVASVTLWERVHSKMWRLSAVCSGSFLVVWIILVVVILGVLIATVIKIMMF